MKLYPMVLTPFVSETVWGGRRLIDEYSVVTDKRNAAEAWVMSAHKNGSSTVANGEFSGRTLREIYLEHPELGGKNCAGFSDFPVLIKFMRYARASCSPRFSRTRIRPTEYMTTAAWALTASRASFMLRMR